jgi:hypothetical protein
MSHLKILTRQLYVVNCKNRDMRWEKLNIPNYRPTYILSGFLKIYVCESYRKVMLHFNSNGIFVNEESGFRKDSSANTDTVELLRKTLGSHKGDH